MVTVAPRVLAAVAFLGISTSACGPRILAETPMAIDAAWAELGGAYGAGAAAAADSAIEAAGAAARDGVRAAVASAPADDAAWLRGRLLEAAFAGDIAAVDAIAAAGLGSDARADAKAATAHIVALLEAGRLDEARGAAWRAATASKPHRARFLDLWYESFYRDASFWSPEPETIVPGVQLTRLERLGGGSTVTLKFKVEDVTVGAFKPYQTRMQSNYRGEIAAFRLCALMHCGFEVPHNREVRIEHDDFLELYGLRTLEQSGGYAANFSDLIFFEDENGERWLHGTLKEWVPGFTQFPIEFTSYWTPLVARGVRRAELDAMTFADAIRPFGGENGNRGGIVARAETATATDLARQLSTLHVFDFLINNWDRYSGQFWGVNCQWNHGRFVSIDNGASFQAPTSGSRNTSATWGRRGEVHVFSRSMYDALRWMDPQHTRALLFPASEHFADEAGRFKLFLERRERLLRRLEREIEDRGVDAVLIFD